MSNVEIATGKYDGWAIHHNADAPEGAQIELPITSDKDGFAQVCIKLAIAEKGQPEGQEEAFAADTIYQTVDPDAPVRGNTESTPFEFAVLCLLALGAESREAINAALGEAFAAGRSSVVIPGLGRAGVKADLNVKYTPSKKPGGEPFRNISVYSRRDVAPDKAKSLADRFKAMGSGGAASPFAPRGTPIAPPAARR